MRLLLHLLAIVFAIAANISGSLSDVISKNRRQYFLDRFGLFYCEKMKECNMIPKEKVCGREVTTRGLLWFENVCVIWKINCLQISHFLEVPAALCQKVGGAPIKNSLIDSNWFQPLGYNPYYTHDKNINT